MDNILARTISILILVITLCIVPAFYLNIYYDFVNYNNKLDEAYLFLDNAILKGEIFETETLMDYRFEVVVLRNRYFPNDKLIKNIAYTKHTILKDIEENDSFKLNVGDVVVVTRYNDLNRLNLFMKRIFNINFFNIPVRVAGVVKNECI